MIDTGNAILTFTGCLLDPTQLRPQHVDIGDIAHSLANTCRFRGHCREFYSVAQHSVIVSNALPSDLQMTGLLHDASEAYLVDLPRPLHTLFPQISTLHDQVMDVISEALGFVWPMPKEVRVVDDMACEAEMRDIMGREGRKLANGRKLDAPIVPVGPDEAKLLFLDRFEELEHELATQ